MNDRTQQKTIQRIKILFLTQVDSFIEPRPYLKSLTHILAAKGVRLTDWKVSLPSTLHFLVARGAKALARAETPTAKAKTTKAVFIIILTESSLLDVEV